MRQPQIQPDVKRQKFPPSNQFRRTRSSKWSFSSPIIPETFPKSNRSEAETSLRCVFDYAMFLSISWVTSQSIFSPFKNLAISLQVWVPIRR